MFMLCVTKFGGAVTSQKNRIPSLSLNSMFVPNFICPAPRLKCSSVEGQFLYFPPGWLIRCSLGLQLSEAAREWRVAYWLRSWPKSWPSRSPILFLNSLALMVAAMVASSSAAERRGCCVVQRGTGMIFLLGQSQLPKFLDLAFAAVPSSIDRQPIPCGSSYQRFSWCLRGL